MQSFRDILLSKSGSFRKADQDRLALLCPFPNPGTVAARNIMLTECLRVFQGRKELVDLGEGTAAWLTHSINADNLSEFFRAEDFNGDAADDIDCVLTLQNWCTALQVPVAVSIQDCRVAIREAQAGVRLDVPPVTLSADIIDEMSTPVKIAIAAHLRVDVDTTQPLALFNVLLDKEIQQASLSDIEASAQAPALRQRAALFAANYLRSLSHGERILLALLTGCRTSSADLTSRAALLHDLLSASADDIKSKTSGDLWKHAANMWTTAEDTPIPLKRMGTAQLSVGYLLPLFDGTHLYFYQVTSVTALEDLSMSFVLNKLSDGAHIYLPETCTITDDVVLDAWVYNPPSGPMGDQAVISLSSAMPKEPLVPVKVPSALINKRKRDTTVNSTALGSGRAILTHPIVPTLDAIQAEGEPDFTFQRGATVLEASSWHAGTAARLALGDNYRAICRQGTFTSPSILTMVQSAVTRHLMSTLSILSNKKQLSQLLLWNLSIAIDDTKPQENFHIKLCLPDQKAVSSNTQLRDAIQNFSMIWDQCIDPSGSTSFMQEIVGDWSDRLAVGMPRSVSMYPTRLLTNVFMSNLLQVAKFLHTSEAATLSRIALRAKLKSLMTIDAGELMAEAANPLWAPITSSKVAQRSGGRNANKLQETPVGLPCCIPGVILPTLVAIPIARATTTWPLSPSRR
jgi:hypothetical protein